MSRILTKYALTRYFAKRSWLRARPDCVVSAVLSPRFTVANNRLLCCPAPRCQGAPRASGISTAQESRQPGMAKSSGEGDDCRGCNIDITGPPAPHLDPYSDPYSEPRFYANMCSTARTQAFVGRSQSIDSIPARGPMDQEVAAQICDRSGPLFGPLMARSRVLNSARPRVISDLKGCSND